MKRVLLLLLLNGLGLIVFSQTKIIGGKVTDANGSPIAGVSISVKGSTQGSVTNESGSYTLRVPATAKTLVFSAVGATAKEVNIGNQTAIDVSMATATNNLQEVVVTSLGITRDKRSLGYATQTIKAEEIANKGEVNIVNALQGKVAGVNITSASGGAGASSNINIRGIHSFTGNNQPLFVVDGVPISNNVDRTNGGSLGTNGDYQPSNRALDVDINNVESVNVLKGAVAAALYGSRAANGVIVITTKKGSSARGRVDIVLNSSYSIQNASGLPELQNEYGQGLNGLYNPASANSWGPKFGSTPTLSNGLLLANGTTIDYRAYPNNIQDYFETGSILENSLTINGGDVKQNYTFSLGNTKQNGILPNTSLGRISVKFGANTTLREKLKLGGSITYTATNQDGVVGGNGSSAIGQLVNVPRSFDLPATRNNYKTAEGKNIWFISGHENPYFSVYENPVTSNLSRFQGNVTLGYDFASWLNISYRLGLDQYIDRRKQIFAVGSARVPTGLVLNDNFFRSELDGNLIITAKKNKLFLEGLNANFLLGQNVNQRNFQDQYVQGNDLTIPGFYNASNATVFTNGTGERSEKRRLLGYYGQLSLAYNNYLFVEFTGRVDQSSTLPEDKNTYFYPAVSASFVFTDAFKLRSDVFSYGKLRASAARVGNDADPYLLASVYVPASYGNNVASASFPFTVNGTTISGFGASSRIASSSLSPEFTTSYEAGINLGFFKNRLTLDLAYFDEVSKDQIINVALAPTTGYATQTTNIGEMTNKGVEALVTISAITGKNFSWDISGNFTRIRNNVVAIKEGITSFQVPGSAFTGTIPTIRVGEAYGVIVGSKFPRSPQGDLIINPATGVPVTGIAGQVLADPNPDYTFGITNTFKFQNFTLSGLFDFQKGGQIVSLTAGSLRSGGTLKETAVDRDIPRIFPGVIQTADGKYIPNYIQIPAQLYWRSFGSQSDLNVYDATTFRLREISLGYDLNKNLTGKSIKGIRLGVFARNVFFVSPNSPIDPAVNTAGAGNIRGLELQSAPNVSTYGANLNISL